MRKSGISTAPPTPVGWTEDPDGGATHIARGGEGRNEQWDDEVKELDWQDQGDASQLSRGGGGPTFTAHPRTQETTPGRGEVDFLNWNQRREVRRGVWRSLSDAIVDASRHHSRSMFFAQLLCFYCRIGWRRNIYR